MGRLRPPRLQKSFTQLITLLARTVHKRAGNFDYTFYYTYNPPKRKQNWVNKKYETSFPAGNTYIHHSTYLDNPHLSKAFINEAEEIKAKNDKKYRWEYLGEAIGTGVVPFDNLQIKKGIITDDMVRSFDNIRQGIDFGYGPDPLAFVRWHYDKKRSKIYALAELYDHKVSNRELAKWIKSIGYESNEITADSAEPKSIDELKKEHGIRRVSGAKKGPDSVQYGEEWLGDLDEIVIDPLRTLIIKQIKTATLNHALRIRLINLSFWSISSTTTL